MRITFNGETTVEVDDTVGEIIQKALMEAADDNFEEQLKIVVAQTDYFDINDTQISFD